MEEELSVSILKLMANEGLMPSVDEEEKRKYVVQELKRIVVAWAKRVAWQRGLQKENVAATCATLLTYGSYGLGVHDPESDIDALCICPHFATLAEDFFIVLRKMLKGRSEISEILCVKNTKVPLMRFKFAGIPVDLSYAKLELLVVPENVNIFNPFNVRNIDETSWKNLSRVHANQQILQLVPNLENFQLMLRCIKLWAKKRGVYGNLNGFLGGVHLAILVAYVCQNQPDANLSALISTFFGTFAIWPWPKPVVLQDGKSSTAEDVFQTGSYMPILLPSSLHEECHSNITKSTFYKIRAEFLRGHALTKDLLKPDYDWRSLFGPFPYSKHHTRFVRIQLSAPSHDELRDWVGWVKSRFHCLLLKLEVLQGFCDPNPAEYVHMESLEPKVVFYWGLNLRRNDFMDIKSVEEEFVTNICSGYHGNCWRMELSIVRASELAKDAQFDAGNRKKIKACWKIPDYSPQRIPMYSKHLPNYFVGYVTTDGETK